MGGPETSTSTMMRCFANRDCRSRSLARTVAPSLAAPRLASAASPVHRLLWRASPALGMVQRILDPRPPAAPPLSPKAERLLEKLVKLGLRVSLSKSPYTAGTRDVIRRLVNGMLYRTVQIERNGSLDDPQKVFLHRITERYL